MKLLFLFVLITIVAISGCATMQVGPGEGEDWKALHLLGYNNDADLAELGAVPDAIRMTFDNEYIAFIESQFHQRSKS